jgi:hypothetical protein
MTIYISVSRTSYQLYLPVAGRFLWLVAESVIELTRIAVELIARRKAKNEANANPVVWNLGRLTHSSVI